ncbi:MAG TPA: rhombosortase [Woeseiaceae bacterium]|nr:rhombosortase [Woeseiaceae bacterium]
MGLNHGDSERQRHGSWHTWLVPIGVTLAAVAIAAAGDAGREYLRYDRSGIADGEFWRLVTGHFVHLGVSHLLLNLAGLMLVWFLLGQYLTRAQWALALAISIVGIDAGFWWLEPQLSWYVGLSGALHGMLAAGVVMGMPEGRAETRILAAALVAKLAYEQLVGPLPGSEASSGGNVIVAAHLYGALAGALTAGGIQIRVRARASL